MNEEDWSDEMVEAANRNARKYWEKKRMTTQPELLPCPFCGEAPGLTEIEPHTHKIASFMPDHPGSWVIECGCGVGIIGGKKDGILKHWNTRTPAQGEHGQLIDDLGLLYKNTKHAEGMDMNYTLCITETQTIAKAILALQGQGGGEC